MTDVQRRYAYLQTEDAPKWVDNGFMFDIFASITGISHELWDTFDVTRGEMPDTQALRAYAGIVLTGSHYNVSDSSLLWVPELLQLIRHSAALPKQRVVAICFGCQAVAAALGGDVGQNPDGFVYRAEAVTMTPAAGRLLPSDANGLSSRPLTLLASHGEQVRALPPASVRLGWSAGSPNEFFLAGEYGNFLCCQAHPELEPYHFTEKISPALVSNGALPEAEVRLANAGISSSQLDSPLIRSIMQSWLAQGNPSD